MRPGLLETLCIEPSLVLDNFGSSESKQKMAKYLQAAEDAWSSVYEEILCGERNFILWFRDLLRETRECGAWVPSVFLKRLRQLERGELKIYDRAGRVTLPLHAGLPIEFIEACDFLGLKFPNIVPGLDGSEFVDAFGRSSRQANAFVEKVVNAWSERPKGIDDEGLRSWLQSAIEEEEED